MGSWGERRRNKTVGQTLAREITNNQINIYITEVEDLISAWQQSRNKKVGHGQPRTCHIAHPLTADQHSNTEKQFSKQMSVAYHAHGRTKKVVISDMKALDEYLLEKVTYSKKNIAPYVSPIFDGFVLARVTRDLGITGKVIPKIIDGRQYIVFSGHPGLRKIFAGTIYKANNVKIVNMAIGKLGIAKSIVKGTIITLILTVPLTIAEFFLRDPKNLYALVGTIATDLIKIGIPALMMAIGGIGTTGSSILAFLPMGLVIIISLSTGLALNAIDEKYQVTKKLIAALEDLPYKAQSAAQISGEGIWKGIINPGGGTVWRNMLRRQY